MKAGIGRLKHKNLGCLRIPFHGQCMYRCMVLAYAAPCSIQNFSSVQPQLNHAIDLFLFNF